MAIDLFPVKSSPAKDGQIQPTKGLIGNSDINFAELMRNSGARLGNGLMAISDRAGITAIIDKGNGAAKFEDRPQNTPESQAERYDSPEPSSDPVERSAASPRDDPSRDQGTNTTSDQGEPADQVSVASEVTPDDHASDQGQQQSAKGDDGDQGSAANEGANENTDNENGDETGQAASSGEQPTEQAANGGENAATGNGKGIGSSADQILQSLLASTQTNGQAGQSAEHGKQSTNQAGPAENATKGLTTALGAVTKNTDGTANTAAQNATVTDAANSNKGGASASAKEGFNLHAAQAAQVKANSATQTINTGAGGDGQASAAAATGKATAAQQSAQLARMVGDGPKVAVSVQTGDEAAVVVSKPTASLTSSAALIGENNSQNGRGHQAQNPTATGPGLAQANSAQTQAQANTAQAAVQAQANISTGGEAKGLIQAAQQVGTTGSVASVGGEGVALTGNAGTAAQTQNSAQAQASNAPRQALPGQAVTDQVSVQITRAVNAGVDKITINLKPADLGRVDVKLEIGHDGRVSAIVTADNRNTLDLLQRDGKELQQALADAGLQMDNDSLSFNLRERGEQGSDSKTAGSEPGSETIDDGTDGSDTPLAGLAPHIISDTRVDIRA